MRLYSAVGRPSMAPEKLLKALLIHTIRSERLLMEQLSYNLLFRWFVGLSMDESAWVPTVYSKNRDRQDGGDQRSKDDPGNPTVDFRGEKRRNETHESATDADSRLARKSGGHKAKLAYCGNVIIENRHGLVVDTELLQCNGTAERDAALLMVERLEGTQQVTVAADKGYDTQVREMRVMKATPHVSQNHKRAGGSAIDGRTTRHAGYQISQRKRKRIEEVFGWMKTVGMLRKTRHRGVFKIGWVFTFAAAAYNLVRMRNLLPTPVHSA